MSLEDKKLFFNNPGEMSVWIDCSMTWMRQGSSVTDATQKADAFIMAGRDRLRAGLSIVAPEASPFPNR